MNVHRYDKCAIASSNVFASLMPSSFTITPMSSSSPGLTPYFAEISAPSYDNIFFSNTPCTGPLMPNRSCPAFVIKPILYPATGPNFGFSSSTNRACARNPSSMLNPFSKIGAGSFAKYRSAIVFNISDEGAAARHAIVTADNTISRQRFMPAP